MIVARQRPGIFLLSRGSASWRRRAVTLLFVALAMTVPFFLGGSDAPADEDGYGLVALPDDLAGAASLGVEQDRLAPDFRLAALGGEDFRLSDTRGHGVVLNLWATWCGPCREEMPALKSVAERHAADGLLVVGINLRESPESVAAFAQEFALRFPIALDSTGEVMERYLRLGPPNTIFIRPDGTVDAVHIGALSEAELESAVARILPVGAQ